MTRLLRGRAYGPYGVYLTFALSVRTVRIYVRTVRIYRRRTPRLRARERIRTGHLRRTVCAGRRALNRAKQGPGTRRWAVTFVATAASTYALDAVATAAGVLLAASALLGGADHGLVLVFLAAHLCRLGRWAAREPERELDAARGDRDQHQRAVEGRARPRCARAASLRARRIASAIGYVGTEIAKEVPYYAGAFGAAVLSDSVSSNEALVFLGGANLGAAAYEYGLAGVTRTFLRRRSTPHASFDTDWVPKRVPGRLLQRGRAGRARDDRASSSTRCGTLRPASRCCSSASARRSTTCSWRRAARRRSTSATTCRRTCARSSAGSTATRTPTTGGRSSATRSSAKGSPRRPTTRSTQREELTRAKITQAARGRRAARPPPLPERYGTVVSAYCADSATADRATWETYMRHIAGLVRPGGTVHHRRPAPLARLPRRRQVVPERERRRARPAGGAEPSFDAARSRCASWPSTSRRATRASCSRVAQRQAAVAQAA